jgi:hypothetical protein
MGVKIASHTRRCGQYIDDFPLLAANHVSKRGAAAVIHADEVHFQRLAKFVIAGL